MIRDRDGVYGDIFRGRVKAMGIKEVLIAARSPWQSPYVERVIGTLRRATGPVFVMKSPKPS